MGTEEGKYYLYRYCNCNRRWKIILVGTLQACRATQGSTLAHTKIVDEATYCSIVGLRGGSTSLTTDELAKAKDYSS
jgi:hypothetical protein